MTEIICSIRDLAAVESEWRTLSNFAVAPMLLHEWTLTAAEVFHPVDELKIVLCRDAAGELEAAAPLVLTHGAPRPALELIGSPFIFEPSGFAFRDLGALQRLARSVLRLGLPLEINRFFAAREAIGAISSLCQQRLLYFERKGSSSPFTSLPKSVPELERGISSKRRSDLRRAMRHAESLGPVTFTIVSPDGDSHAEYFREIMAVEQRSWKEQSGTAMSVDTRYERFFARFTERASKAGLIRIGFMRIGDYTAAFNLAVIFSGAMWVLKIGYDERFAKCSPGVLLMHEMIKSACAGGLSRFEFLGVEEPWLKLWSPEIRTYSNIKAFPINLNGAYAFGAAASEFVLGRMRRLLPASPGFRSS